MIQRLYSAQACSEITFSLTYLLQLRLCFENFLINLESILSPGLFLLRNQRNILVCKKCSFPTGTNKDSGQNIAFARMFSPGWESCLQALPDLPYTLFPTLGRTSHLQECSSLVKCLVCKRFPTLLIPCSLQPKPLNLWENNFLTFLLFIIRMIYCFQLHLF